MLSRKSIILFFLLWCTLCQGQSVRFLNNNLNSAIQLAEKKDKLIFVDTYAPWCIPCKQMEKEFRDPALAQYFNKTFVNIRIDMDSKVGREVHRKYDVIFLPTMMILDKKGNVRYKVDRIMSAKDLLDIAQKIAEPEIFSFRPEKQVAVSTPEAYNKPQIKNKPPSSKTSKLEKEVVVEPMIEKEVEKKPGEIHEPELVTTSGNEKIIHVFDSNAKDLPPGLLKQQAYLALQLMDGSHQEASRKYLDTQDDWSSVENMRFIYDFLQSTDSKEFVHLMSNRLEYENLIGKQKVYRSISILVYDRLDRGFPRPNFQETKDLFSYIGGSNHEQLAYEHYMKSLYERGNSEQYITLANQYIKRFSDDNDQIFYNLANVYSETGSGIDKSLKYISRAIEINPYNFQYYDTQAYLYYLDGRKDDALASANQAKDLAVKNGIKTHQIQTLIEMIKEDLD